jgi:hypothetical protein
MLLLIFFEFSRSYQYKHLSEIYIPFNPKIVFEITFHLYKLFVLWLEDAGSDQSADFVSIFLLFFRSMEIFVERVQVPVHHLRSFASFVNLLIVFTGSTASSYTFTALVENLKLIVRDCTLFFNFCQSIACSTDEVAAF